MSTTHPTILAAQQVLERRQSEAPTADQHAAGSVEAEASNEGLLNLAKRIEEADERPIRIAVKAAAAIRATLALAKPVVAGELLSHEELQSLLDHAVAQCLKDNPNVGVSGLSTNFIRNILTAYGQQCADSRPAGGVAATDPSCPKGWYKYYTCQCAGCATLAASAAQPAADVWTKYRGPERIDWKRPIDVVLDNGVTRERQGYNHIDWTAVRDWRYSPEPGSASAVQAGAVPDGWQAALEEVERATRKFPTWPTDPLHAVAVLGEEFGELTKAVLQTTYEPHKVAEGELRTEAIQTAAMALRFLASLDDYQFVPSEQHKQGAAAPNNTEG